MKSCATTANPSNCRLVFILGLKADQGLPPYMCLLQSTIQDDDYCVLSVCCSAWHWTRVFNPIWNLLSTAQRCAALRWPCSVVVKITIF